MQPGDGPVSVLWSAHTAESRSWTGGVGSGSAAFTAHAATDVSDRLIDHEGNFVIDILGTFISLGGGFSLGDADGSAVTWTPGGL